MRTVGQVETPSLDANVSAKFAITNLIGQTYKDGLRV